MQSITDIVKELLTPEKTKRKLSPEREKIMRQTRVILKRKKRDKKLDAGKRKAKCCYTRKNRNNAINTFMAMR